MSCSPFDLRDYFFGELPENDRRQADLHIKSCVSCQEELGALRSTQAVLLTVPDEEIPQRIGFVSDRVYEPSRMLRWWRAFWGSGPRLVFASAAMLSMAILMSGTRQPSADVSRQVNEAVAKAVAESDARHEQRTAQLLTAVARRFEAQRNTDMDIADRYARRDYRVAVFGGSR